MPAPRPSPSSTGMRRLGRTQISTSTTYSEWASFRLHEQSRQAPFRSHVAVLSIVPLLWGGRRLAQNVEQRLGADKVRSGTLLRQPPRLLGF